MGDKYYLNEHGEFFEPKRTAGIIAGVLAAIFGIAFVIMLILFLFYKTENSQSPIIFVYAEDGGSWDDEENLDIFYNGEFGTNKIAPYSSGTYTFLFQNSSDFTLEYSVKLAEDNEYDIALYYRLKRDGAYIVDEYARVDDFTCSGITIEGASTHSFELEWYWDGDVSDENDTLAGIAESIYTLTITITATAAA